MAAYQTPTASFYTSRIKNRKRLNFLASLEIAGKIDGIRLYVVKFVVYELSFSNNIEVLCNILMRRRTSFYE